MKILGLDMSPPRTDLPDEFRQADTRDPKILDMLQEFAPDTVVHMAFIVDEALGHSLMRDININGSKNVFRAVSTLKPARFLYYSSMTAYGAWPDNPIPIEESWPLRPNHELRYAAEKTELEAEIVKFAATHSDMHVSWVRPCIILGQGVRNYISNYVLRSHVVLLPDGVDSPAQFVHEEDLARATWAVLAGNGRGPFNVCPEDWMKWSEIAKLRGKYTIKVPSRIARWAISTYRFFGLPDSALPGMGSPPGLLSFLRHSWVGTPKRLREEFGFQFEHSTRSTIQQALDQIIAERNKRP